jgi:hypothetical protein
LSELAIALDLTLEHGRNAFEPGSRLSGVASWSAQTAPRGLELRVIWTSQGAGGRDFTIAETIPFHAPLAVERRPFIFTLPAGPYSFIGSLISLAWTLQLVALPGEEKTQVGITVAPGRRAIDLRPDDPGPPGAPPRAP